jgi:hypothetical protein
MNNYRTSGASERLAVDVVLHGINPNLSGDIDIIANIQTKSTIQKSIIPNN